jgi:GNAT superfamily N-acetyltransferase
MGLIPVLPGQVATIVTSLEMLTPPTPRPLPSSPFRLVRWPEPKVAPYRGLFRRVGEPWLWFSRLIMDDDRLAAIIADPAVEVMPVIDRAGIELGLLELDFRKSGECELSFLGLVPELAGKGHGRWLMGHALSLAWRKGIGRVWVHTCTLDHPSALGFYRASGFVPFARSVETFADPRIAGILDREAAPHVPIIGG